MVVRWNESNQICSIYSNEGDIILDFEKKIIHHDMYWNKQAYKLLKTAYMKDDRLAGYLPPLQVADTVLSFQFGTLVFSRVVLSYGWIRGKR